MSEEEEALAELKRMSHEELLKVDHKEVWWICCIRMCKCSNKMLDFGIHPFYYWRKKWMDISQYIYFCSKHLKHRQRYTNLHLKQKAIEQLVADERPLKKKPTSSE